MIRKTIAAAAAAALSLAAPAFEKYMMRIPDSLSPQDGAAGGAAVPGKEAASIPLKGGGYVAIWNQTPREKAPDGAAGGAGVAPDVAGKDVVTLLRKACGKCPSVFAGIGGSTFFAFYCGGCKAYEGVLVSKGAAFTLSVYLPEGRGFDDEVRGILAQVEFSPPPGYGVDSALKLYGPGSRLSASVRYTVLKKMVEARPECWELVAALLEVSADHPATGEWCRRELQRLNPAHYGPPGESKRSARAFDAKNTDETDAAMAVLDAPRKAAKASASVPG